MKMTQLVFDTHCRLKDGICNFCEKIYPGKCDIFESGKYCKQCDQWTVMGMEKAKSMYAITIEEPKRI